MNVLIPDIDNQNSILERIIESDSQRLSVDELIKLKELSDKHRQPVAQHLPIRRPVSQ